MKPLIKSGAGLRRGSMTWVLLLSVLVALWTAALVAAAKDYYKVLGVAPDSDERQIKSAYRKASKKFHPDKAHKQGVSKEEAEKKMAAINEAYEVLSDSELRARFDRGDDPNSQEQHNPFQGSPFGHGGHPFMHQQGGGQQFKFHFGGGGGGGPFGF
ncbi:hypothetical protein Golomagni_07317 [Golovinomyces magnicellulatus]|nr:hypothetical protein Golomagni_07317 [Golovinomyces magnicellulatus]